MKYPSDQTIPLLHLVAFGAVAFALGCIVGFRWVAYSLDSHPELLPQRPVIDEGGTAHFEQ